MPKLTFISVGASKNSQYKALEKEYLERLSHYTFVDTIIIADSKKATTNEKINEESEKIISKITPGSQIVLLDIFGKNISTEELSKKISHWDNTAVKTLTLIVGGAFGVSDALKKLAHLRLSLSLMTFPHEMARVIMLEQLYRAYTIIRGEKYHH